MRENTEMKLRRALYKKLQDEDREDLVNNFVAFQNNPKQFCKSFISPGVTFIEPPFGIALGFVLFSCVNFFSGIISGNPQNYSEVSYFFMIGIAFGSFSGIMYWLQKKRINEILSLWDVGGDILGQLYNCLKRFESNYAEGPRHAAGEQEQSFFLFGNDLLRLLNHPSENKEHEAKKIVLIELYKTIFYIIKEQFFEYEDEDFLISFIENWEKATEIIPETKVIRRNLKIILQRILSEKLDALRETTRKEISELGKQIDALSDEIEVLDR